MDEPFGLPVETAPTLEASSRDFEKLAITAELLERAGRRVDPEPTPAQVDAGNYRKAHVRLHGLGITIENPKGSYRSGVSPDGKNWRTLMRSHYGYIKRTEGADGDHIDVFIAGDPESEIVFVVNQVDPKTSKFDELKIIFGTTNRAAAREAYLENYEDGWQGMGQVNALTVDQFKWWLEHGDTTKPIVDGCFVSPKQLKKAMDAAEVDSAKSAALLPGVTLQPHQQAVADTGHDPESKLLVYHTVGAGKTLAAIGAAENAAKPYTAITPASLRTNYSKERERWTDQKLPVNLKSYNSLAKGQVEPADTVVYDESQRLRNPDSLMSHHARELADQAHHAYFLSGTPIVNHPHDLAPLMTMLTGKEITPDEFDKKFIDERKISPGFWGWLKGVKPVTEPAMKNQEEFENLLHGHVHYYAPDKPGVERMEEHHITELGPEQTRLYQGFWDQLPAILRWKMQTNFPLSRQEMLRLSSFLSGPRQVGLSTYPFMKGNADPLLAYNQSPKLKKAVGLMLDHLKEDPQHKGVAFSNFIDAGLTPYAAALGKAGIPYGIFHGGLSDAQRKKAVNDYNTGKTRVLLLGPSGGEGISLRGTRLLQVLDPHWNAARSEQAIGRGIRFDSHLHLPESERNVKVQRFASHLPKSFWQRVWRGLVGGDDDPRKNSPGVDTYLEQMVARKDRLNQQFLGELQRIGKTAGDDKLKEYVEAVLATVPDGEGVDCWYKPGEHPKIRVSVGDWAERETYKRFEQFKSVFGEGNCEIEAEIGPPKDEGWEQLKAERTKSGGEPCPRCGGAVADGPVCPRCGWPHIDGTDAGVGRLWKAAADDDRAPGSGGMLTTDDLREFAEQRHRQVEKERGLPEGSYTSRIAMAEHLVKQEESFDDDFAKGVRLISEGLDLLQEGDCDEFYLRYRKLKHGKPDDSEHTRSVGVDLDGTLAKEEKPFDPDEIEEPREGAKELLEAIRDEGARIIIHTVRGDEDLIVRWLDDHDLPWDHINENPDQPPGSSSKLYADVYADNRAVSADRPLAEVQKDVISRLRRARSS